MRRRVRRRVRRKEEMYMRANTVTHLFLLPLFQEYRRADGKFFKRVVTPVSKVETFAFAEDMTIADFVAVHTSYSAGGLQLFRSVEGNGG